MVRALVSAPGMAQVALVLVLGSVVYQDESNDPDIERNFQRWHHSTQCCLHTLALHQVRPKSSTLQKEMALALALGQGSA